MELAAIEEDGARIVEGQSGESLMANPDDTSLVIEACFSHGTSAAPWLARA